MSSSEEENSSDEDEETVKEESSKKKKEPAEEKRKKVEIDNSDVTEGRSVFLRNLPFDASQEDLEELVKPYGRAIKVSIVKNEVGVSKGVAFVEFASKDEADRVVVHTKELSLNGRAVFARTALPQTTVENLRKIKEVENKAKQDKRNLALAKEGEIREGSKAWNEISEQDRARRQHFAELKFQKLKNVENFVDPSKIVIHNIPKSYSEEDIHLLARKAANGDIKMEVGKRRSKTVSCHLMRSNDPEEQNQSLGFAFIKFQNAADAMKALRVLNNHPTAFFNDKRPIVEFAVENAKALKILADRQERNSKKIELRKKMDAMSMNEPEPGQIQKRKRPWQIAREERKKKRRAARLEEKNNEDEKLANPEEQPRATKPKPAPKKPAVHHKEPPAAENQQDKPEYAGIAVQRGIAGHLKRSKHTGTKIRARDRGKITLQRQKEQLAKRKENLKKLSVVVKKEKGAKPKEKKEDLGFDSLVASYKNKISAGLKLL